MELLPPPADGGFFFFFTIRRHPSASPALQTTGNNSDQFSSRSDSHLISPSELQGQGSRLLNKQSFHTLAPLLMAKSAQIDKVKTLEGSKSNKGEIFHTELKLLQGSEATMVTDAPNVSTFSAFRGLGETASYCISIQLRYGSLSCSRRWLGLFE